MTPTVSPPPELRSRGPPRTAGGPGRVRVHEGVSSGRRSGRLGSARRLLRRSPTGRWRPNARPASTDEHGSDDRGDDEDEEDEPDPHLQTDEDRREEAAPLIPIARQVVAASGLARAVVGFGS